MTNAHTPFPIMVAPQNAIKQCVNILIAFENTIRLSAGFLIVSADSLILSASILIVFSTVINGLKIPRNLPRNACGFSCG
ncbi:hypothetical protein HMPREF9332_01584 [Alloprevotella rava F0323]|uniref:Uncharacterized protein n=1 Tax=Alloprevotella rava F0323 TaxID=679199 RepID=G5GD36_9BACT|nr:hypothetical protein HMPREF9332_01584 [Alloprevotella rava F0323]